jgi:signal peptidase I
MTDSSAAASSENSDLEEPEPQRSRSKSLKLFLRDVVLILLAAILISFLIKTFLIRSFYIPSGSMEDTLLINDRIIVNELEPRLMPIKHGDVVVFQDPGDWLPATEDNRTTAQKAIETALSVVGLAAPDSDDHLIKRVIGLPGDHVTCCGNFGFIRVNGVPLDEPYINVPDGEPSTPEEFDVTVPEGMMWVLGDNRYQSADSLYHMQEGDPGGGFVPIDDVVGRAILISWPAERWTWLDNYPVVFRGVEDGQG